MIRRWYSPWVPFAPCIGWRTSPDRGCSCCRATKGYTHEDELFYLTGQAIQFHGSFSTMVNYHAMGPVHPQPRRGVNLRPRSAS